MLASKHGLSSSLDTLGLECFGLTGSGCALLPLLLLFSEWTAPVYFFSLVIFVFFFVDVSV
jgi:hypothetical protein